MLYIYIQTQLIILLFEIHLLFFLIKKIKLISVVDLKRLPPVCCCHSYTSIVKGNSALPPEDRLLKFLVDNSTDAEETVQCANCDQESNKKVPVDL